MEDDQAKTASVVINASDECLQGVLSIFTKKGKADFTVTAVRFAGFFEYEGNKGFALEWETKSAGFGELAICEESGKIVCDNEAMSADFIKAVLAKWVDGMAMVHTPCDEHGKMLCRPCRDRNRNGQAG